MRLTNLCKKDSIKTQFYKVKLALLVVFINFVVSVLKLVCVRVRARHTAIKFFKCPYLNSHATESIHIWRMGTYEDLLRFYKNGPWLQASGWG